MRTNRREFLQATTLASLAAAHPPYSAPSDSHTNGISMDEHLNASEIARKHLSSPQPLNNFFLDTTNRGMSTILFWRGVLYGQSIYAHHGRQKATNCATASPHQFG